jgi:TolB-like protein
VGAAVLPEERVQRRLAAILAADVVGYSRLMETDEEGTRERLRRLHTQFLDPLISSVGGRIVKTTGDGILAEFPSAIDAVRIALSIQTEIAEHNVELPEKQKIVFRVGINVGDVIIEGDDIHGDGVNVAARLEGICEPGEVYVSGTVYDQAAGKLAAVFDDLGDQTVKNIAKPIRTYRVRTELENYDNLDKPTTSDTPPLPDKPSIAVLPFANMSGDPEQEYFTDGITEDLITALSRFSWFFVIARNSSFSLKGQNLPVRQVSQELGVRYVLEGSVRLAGNRIRVTTQLIDAETDQHIWAERYDRDLDDIFAVQDEITESVAQAVAPELLAAEMRQARRRETPDLDTWTQIMRAHALISNYTAEDNVAAKELLEEVITTDPQSAIAHADLATVHLWSGMFGWKADTHAAYNAALRAAEKAVDIDSRDAWARTILGWTKMFSQQYEDAIRDLELAIASNPNLAFAHGVLGVINAFTGHTDKAIRMTEYAINLSPRDPLLGCMYGLRAISFFAAGDYVAAVEWSKRSTQHRPPVNLSYRIMAAALGKLGRTEEAREAGQKLLSFVPGLTVAASVQQMPWKLPEQQEALAEGLRVAGLPEE